MKVTEKYTKDEFENRVAIIALLAILALIAVIVLLAIFWTPWVLLLGPAALAGLLLLATIVFAAVDTIVNFFVECAESEGDTFLTKLEKDLMRKQKEDEMRERQREKEKLKRGNRAKIKMAGRGFEMGDLNDEPDESGDNESDADDFDADESDTDVLTNGELVGWRKIQNSFTNDSRC